jgi:hypothetical protein
MTGKEDGLHFRDAVDEANHAGKNLDLKLGDEERRVGDVRLDKERVGVLGGEFLVKAERKGE